MNECVNCFKRISEKRTAWIKCEPYCSECCKEIVYLKRLNRNLGRNKKKQSKYQKNNYIRPIINVRNL